MRADQTPRRVNEISTPSLENKVKEHTSLMRQMITGTQQQVKSYGICSNIGYAIDMCLTLHEEPIQQVNATGVFPGLAQHKYDPYVNTDNLGWEDHPSFSYENSQNQY